MDFKLVEKNILDATHFVSNSEKDDELKTQLQEYITILSKKSSDQKKLVELNNLFAPNAFVKVMKFPNGLPILGVTDKSGGKVWFFESTLADKYLFCNEKSGFPLRELIPENVGAIGRYINSLKNLPESLKKEHHPLISKRDSYKLNGIQLPNNFVVTNSSHEFFSAEKVMKKERFVYDVTFNNYSRDLHVSSVVLKYQIHDGEKVLFELNLSESDSADHSAIMFTRHITVEYSPKGKLSAIYDSGISSEKKASGWSSKYDAGHKKHTLDDIAKKEKEDDLLSRLNISENVSKMKKLGEPYSSIVDSLNDVNRLKNDINAIESVFGVHIEDVPGQDLEERSNSIATKQSRFTPFNGVAIDIPKSFDSLASYFANDKNYPALYFQNGERIRF